VDGMCLEAAQTALTALSKSLCHPGSGDRCARQLAECLQRLSVVMQHRGYMSEALSYTTKALGVVVRASKSGFSPVEVDLWLDLRTRMTALLLGQRRRQEAIDECINAIKDSDGVKDNLSRSVLVHLQAESALAEGQTKLSMQVFSDLHKYESAYKIDYAGAIIRLGCLQLPTAADQAEMVFAKAENLLRLWAAELGFYHSNASQTPPPVLIGEQKQDPEPFVHLPFFEGDVNTTVVGVTSLVQAEHKDKGMMMTLGVGSYLHDFVPERTVNLYYSLLPNMIQLSFQLAKHLANKNKPELALRKALECEKLASYCVYLPPIISAELNFLIANLNWRVFQQVFLFVVCVQLA
jgi:hypothetical protein